MPIPKDVRARMLRVIRPSAAIKAAFQKRLDALIGEMHEDIAAHVESLYARRPPVAMDATPAQDLATLMRALARKWRKRFDQAAPELARYFTTAIKDRTDTQLRNALRKAGVAIKFTMTPELRDVIAAAVHDNVSLIKSIATQHLTQVEGIVMRGVQNGRDAGTITKELQHQFGVTKRRATFIAQQQVSSLSAATERARHVELGVSTIWLHSHGGEVPRPSHLANNGKLYDARTGWFDPDEKKFILPGQLPRCRCSAGVILPSEIKARNLRPV